MDNFSHIYPLFLSSLLLSLIFTATNSEQSILDSVKCVDCAKDFIYCRNNYYNSNESDLASFHCECTDDYPIVLDGRFCLPKRSINESCFLTEQCQQNLSSNIGCFLNGKNLLEAHNAVRQIVEKKSSVNLFEEARCSCYPNHYYDNQRQVCLCLNSLQTSNQIESYKCQSSNVMVDDFTTGYHYSETIVFWIIFMLILIVIFMLLTIYRKCFYNASHFVRVNHCVYDYEPTLIPTTTLVNMQIINNNQHERRNLIQDHLPSYEEAIHN